MHSPGTGIGQHMAIRFGDNTVILCCDDDLLCQQLSTLIGHCLVDVLSPDSPAPSSTLQVASEQGQSWLLRKDGTQICEGLSRADMAERLVYEVTIALVVGSPDRLVFHAAGLAKGETGLILGGESGSGKSTLSTCMLARSYDFLSDELVSVSLTGEAMQGFPRSIALKRSLDSHHWLHHLIKRPPPCTASGISYVDPDSLRPGCVRDLVRPGILLFPKYLANASTTMRRLSPAEAAYRLMALLLNATLFPDRGFSAVARFARSLAAYSLDYADADQAAKCIEQAIERGFCSSSIGKGGPDKSLS
ncbi:MAG: hypothetical protein Q7O66_02790 [Dehalococcoidia bacterium]|nr:hypothetical protein [Dehalococcoidia bacterium]